MPRGCNTHTPDDLPKLSLIPPLSTRLPLEDHRRREARILHDCGWCCPGVKNIEHIFFYRVGITDAETLKGYLQRAYRLGTEFAAADRAAVETPRRNEKPLQG